MMITTGGGQNRRDRKSDKKGNHSMTRLRFGVLALLAALAPLAGCRTLVRQTISEVKGAQGKVYPVTDASSGALARMNSVQFEPCSTDTGGSITPGSLLTA